MKKALLITSAFVLFYSASSFALPKTNFQNALQTKVNQWRLENNIPGMVVTIYQPTLGKMTVTSGSKNMSAQQPVTTNTLFQIGSITKTFTAAAILNLEAEEKLSINDKINRWFPQYPHWQAITIKQLLNMTSGIFQYESDTTFAKANQANPQREWRSDELLAFSYRHPLYFSPGQNWHYSNANYLLLGEIIEKTTHQKLGTVFDHLLHEKNIILSNTHYIPSTYTNNFIQQMAHGYRDNRDVTAYNMSAFGAAGAMVSNSSDIATWIEDLFGNKVIPQKQLSELMTTVPFNAPPKPKNSRYGLGVYYLHSKQYGDVWWYSGVTNGYISLFMYLPNYQLIVTANINRIQKNNYWLLMPDHSFAQNILALMIHNPVIS